jgi:hypothetical protein
VASAIYLLNSQTRNCHIKTRLQKRLLKLVPTEHRPLFTASGVFTADEIKRRRANLPPSLALLHEMKDKLITNPI